MRLNLTAELPTADERPIGPLDETYVRNLFIADRTPEFLASGLDAATAAAVVADQYRLQTIGYADAFPHAEHRLLLWKGQPAGRLIVADEGDHLHVIDLLVEPRLRGIGLGGRAVRRVQARARAAGQHVTLHALIGTPSVPMYEHLGFVATGASADRLLMEWHP